MSIAATVLSELLRLRPEFAAAWEDERYLWVSDEDGTFSVHGVFAAFSHYISDCVAHEFDPGLLPVFEYVESKLTGDDDVVDDAACTCFLENIMNRVPEKIPPQNIVPLLGPKSLDFCRAYTGTEWR